MKASRILVVITLSILLLSRGFAYDPFYAQKAFDSDKIVRERFKEFSKEFSRTLHLKILHPAGVGCIVDDKKVLWASKFMAAKPITKDQAKLPLEKAFSRLWQRVLNETEFENYLAYKSLEFSKPKRKLAPDIIGLRIDFWDENVNRYAFPFLAKVIIKGNHIYYYYADPATQFLGEPVIEELSGWVFDPS